MTVTLPSGVGVPLSCSVGALSLVRRGGLVEGRGVLVWWVARKWKGGSGVDYPRLLLLPACFVIGVPCCLWGGLRWGGGVVCV